MAEPDVKKPSEISFVFNPEPRDAQVDLNVSQGNFVDMIIVAQNRSGRPVRVQAILDPMDSEASIELDPLPIEVWAPWLAIQETAPEMDFENAGEHRFRVRISLPSNARLGTYRFRLILSGVENPDEEFAASDPISFTVVGPQMDVRPFVIGAAVILALIILGIIAAALLIRPRPSLQVTFQPPQAAVQGEPAQYNLSIANSRAAPASNVMLDVRLPESVIAASAYVPGEDLRHCDNLEGRIRCDLGSLAENETVQVALLAVPGPGAVTITNTQTFTVSAQLGDTTSQISVRPANTQEHTPVSPAPGPYAIALLPSTSTPLFQENFAYQVLAWSTITTTQQLSFTFSLPAGMRYIDPLPGQCDPLTDYFTVECVASLPYADKNSAVSHFDLRAQATTASTTPARLEAFTDQAPEPAVQRSYTTQVVNTALFFNGSEDWAQLGYNQAPKNFTLEMWVHPFSSDDGQSFAGLHLEEPDEVRNLFLVGYWSGSLQVNVNGDYHNLDFPKRIDRYHLAVVVEAMDSDRSKVTVYVNGVEQEWEEPEPPEVCDRCKIFESTMPGGQNPLPWVLGQDWDLGSQGKKLSDFFHGTLAEVRFWDVARTKDEILSTYQVRPRGDEPHLVAYYRLEPKNLDSDVLVSRAASAPPGMRMGATWVEAEPLYGTALRFNGLRDALPVPGLQLSSFQPGADGQVEVTFAGWVLVDAVPSQQEWILGSTVPSGGTLSLTTGAGPQVDLPGSPAAADQAALTSAQSELLAAQQAMQGLGLDAQQAASDRYNARQRLIYALWLFMAGNGRPTTDPDQSPAVQALESTNSEEFQFTDTRLGALAAITTTQEIPNDAVALQVNQSRISELQAELETAQASLDREPVPQNTTPGGAVAPEAQAEALFKALLNGARQDLLNQVDLVNSGTLTPQEQASINPEQILSSRQSEYSDVIAPEVEKILQGLDDLNNLQAFSTQDLQKFVGTLEAVQVRLQRRAERLGQDLAPGRPPEDPASIDLNTRLDLIGRFSQLVEAPIRLLDQAVTLGVQSFVSAPTASSPLVPPIPPLPGLEQARVNVIKLVFLLFDEWSDYNANLQGMIQNAQKNGQLDLLIRTLGVNEGRLVEMASQAATILEGAQAIERYTPTAMLLQLARVDRLEADLVKDNAGDAQVGAERIQAFQNLQNTQAELGSTTTNLETWLKSRLDQALAESFAAPQDGSQDASSLRETIALLATAQYNLQRYQTAQANVEAVQAAQERIDAAQEQVASAQVQANAVTQATQQAQEEAARRQQLEDNVSQAELAVAVAASPEETLAAQRRLEAARTELNNALLDQYRSLAASMDALQVREAALADLDPRLNSAVDRASEAAFSAARRYNVERWIGPWLDFILGTRTPRQTAQDAIRPAALLAAQQALKTQVDAKVDTAQQQLKDTLEKQNRLTNSGGNANLRQQIIDQINAYLDSLNKDVNAAQQNLDEALAQQQGDQGESQVPLVLAEALAQTVADQVTAETVRRLPAADVRTLLSTSAGLESQTKAAVKASVSNALEASRRPVRIRLYYQTAYAIQRLDAEQAAGGLSASERNLKSQLRGQLATVNTAVLRLLNAQNVLLRPASGLGALVGQVADESQAAADINTLIQDLQDALQNAGRAMQVFLSYAEAQGRTSGLTLPAAGATNSAQGNGTTGAQTGEASAGSTLGGAIIDIPAASGSTGSVSGGSAGQTGGANSTGSIDGSTQPAGQGQSGEAAGPGSAAGESTSGQQSNAAGPEASGQVSGTLTASFTPPNLWAGLLVDTDGHVMLAARPVNGGDWSWEKDEKPLPTGQWVHYAGVIRYDAQSGAITDYVLYRDGSPVKGDVTADPPSLTVDSLGCPDGFYIGGLCDTSGRYYFSGRIDEVRVWNRALDQDEIDAWRKLPGADFDEQAYWAFDDGPGRSSAGICPLNLTCDLSPEGRFDLRVLGPAWIEADAGLAGHALERP